MVQQRDDVVLIDAAILSPPQVWQASGHLANFTDPLVDCTELQAALPPRQARRPRRLPELRREAQLHRGPRVQPDVQDPGRPGRGHGRRRLPAPRDRAGHVHQLRAGAADVAQEAAVRDRPGRQELPQRDHPAELDLPDPRVRADGNRVLRAARRQLGVVRVLVQRAAQLVRRARHPGRHAAACAPTTTTSCRTTRPARPTSSSRSRGASTSSRASPSAPTTTSSSTPSTRASGSTTSTRRPTSATCRT